MNESEFAIKASQSSKTLINVQKPSNWKIIHDHQKWIIAIECINAIGAAIPLLIIFKTKYTNIIWIPVNTSIN